ncbi:MAG TPA: ATP-dependent helicase [Burkholderiales bacterium]
MVQLSPEQKAAVQYVRGPLLVLGEAGTGKTSLLAHKIAWLLRDYDVEPRALLVLATNAVTVTALRREVQALLGRKVAGLRILSFAEFALGLLQQAPGAAGLETGFTLYDSIESEALVARLLRDRLPAATALPRDVWRALAERKRNGAAPAAEADRALSGHTASELAAWLHPLYDERLKRANAIDFPDLLPRAAQLLAADRELRERWCAHLRFLLMDEYEQTGSSGHDFARLLAGAGAVPTAAVDDGCDKDAGRLALERFRRDFAQTRLVRLPHNFRTTERIARLARRMLDPCAADAPRPVRARVTGAPVRVLEVRAEQDEAAAIVRALAAHRRALGGDYRDYAILFRRPEQAARLERALQAQRIPYDLYPGGSLLERAEVRDFWAYLKLLANPRDDAAFLRALGTPRRDVDQTTLAALARFAAERERHLFECALDPALAARLAPAQQAALRSVATLIGEFRARAEHAPPAQIALALLEALGYDDWLRDTCNDANIAARRMENVLRLVDMLERMARSNPEARLRGLIAPLELAAALDPPGPEPGAGGVVLVPLHAARGIEHAHVYIAPGADLRAQDPPADAQAERRLAYLGMVRARESVTLVLREDGSPPGSAPRFLGAVLPPEDLERVSSVPAGLTESLLARRPGQTDVLGRYS